MSKKQNKQSSKGTAESNKNSFDIDIEELANDDNEKKLLIIKKRVRFTGNDVRVSIINSLRRAMMDYVPTYAFVPELINITKNTTTSITTDDFIIATVSQLPVLGVDPGIPYLENEYYDEINYSDTNRPKHPTEKNVELYINAVNDTEEPMLITTDNAKCYIDGDEIIMYKKSFALIKLKKGEELKLHAKAVLGIGEINQIWSPVGICALQYGDDTKKLKDQNLSEIEKDITLMIPLQGQIKNAYDVASRACTAIQYKLQMLKEKMLSEKISRGETTNYARIILDEDSTIGEIINDIMQENKEIVYCGGGMVTNLEKKYEIKVVDTTSKINVIDVMINSINKLIKIYDYLEKKFVSMKK